MIEQDIYNKRIVELMKKKTSLIEALNKLLESANKPGTKQKERSGLLACNSSSFMETAGACSKN